MCSLATRGFWLECIAIMREAGNPEMKGTYEDFAKATGCFPDEAKRCIAELKRYNTADVTLVTLRNKIVTLKSRKYARELKAKELSNLRVQKFRDKQNVTPEKRLSERSNKKEEIKEEEKREASAKPTAPAKKYHPAIESVRTITGKLPRIELHETITSGLGSEIDMDKLRECRTAWVARGYNPGNFAWALEWYRNGIPTQNGSGTKTEDPGKRCDACRDTDGRIYGTLESWPCDKCRPQAYKSWLRSRGKV